MSQDEMRGVIIMDRAKILYGETELRPDAGMMSVRRPKEERRDGRCRWSGLA